MSLQTGFRAAHADVFPHHVAQFLVDRVNRLLTLDTHQMVNLSLYGFLCLGKFRQVCRETGNRDLVSQVVLDGVRQYEVTVGQALHQSRCTQTVGTVVREVTFADGKQTLDSGHQFVVYPDAAHRIVDGGINHHRVLVRRYVRDFLVHVKQIAVALCHHILAQTVDSLGEVQEYGQACVVHTITLVATFLGGTAGHVARHQVTEGRITALQVIVAVFFGDVLALQRAFLQLLGVFQFLGHPDAAVGCGRRYAETRTSASA